MSNLHGDLAKEQVARRQGSVTVDAAYTVPAGIRLVRVAPTAARTITLPPPWEWAGQRIKIKAVTDGGASAATYNVTVARSGEERVSGPSNAVITIAAGYVIAESDGEDILYTDTSLA